MLIIIEKSDIENRNINIEDSEFRMKYIKDIGILFEIFYIISKYCPISNSNVHTVITDMNNIEKSSDSDSSNEVYNTNSINNRNNIGNNSRISDSENYNIVTSNLVVILSNFLNNECVNIHVTWYRLYIVEGMQI